jgi:hypothetical protein
MLTHVRYFKRLKLDYPTMDTTRGSKRFVKAMKHLDVSNTGLGFETIQTDRTSGRHSIQQQLPQKLP